MNAFERLWHPVHLDLQDWAPYLVVLVELPAVGYVCMVGHLLDDPMQDVRPRDISGLSWGRLLLTGRES